MKKFKYIVCLVSALSLTAYVGSSILNTIEYKREADYSALDLSQSSTKDIDMKVDEKVTCNLPTDFNIDSAEFNNTKSDIATASSISNGSFEITGIKAGVTEITLTDGNYNFTLFISVKSKESEEPSEEDKKEETYDTSIDINTSSATLTIQDTNDYPDLKRSISNYSKLKNVKVSSSSEGVAQVELTTSGYVIVTGLSAGNADIIISADGCEDRKITVTVYKDIKTDTTIKLSEESPIKIYLDDSTKKTVFIDNYSKLKEEVTANVDDTDICTVSMTSNAFTIKGRKEGKTNITLKCDGADSKTIRVYVYEGTKSSNDEDDEDDDTTTKITKIKFDKSSVTLEEGKSTTLDYTLKPSNATTRYLKFESDDESVATVSESGRVTAKRDGTAVIKAYYTKDEDDVYDEIDVKVTSSKNGSNSDKSTTDNSEEKVESNSSKYIDSIPYYLPVGKYDLTKLLRADESRLKSNILNVESGVNSTNIILDGEIYNIRVYGVAPTDKVNLDFKDLKATHWAYLSAVEAVSRGYMENKNGMNFAPSDRLTYGETFTAMANLLVNKNSYAMKSSREVVDKYMKNFSEEHKAYLAQKSVMSKLPEREIKRYTEPGDIVLDSGISRIHMANILYIFTQDLVGKQVTTAVFKDVQTTDMLNYISSTGLMVGDAKGNFNPNYQLTRAELATILGRLDKLIK